MTSDLTTATDRRVSRETETLLRRYQQLVIEENARQNLVSKATIANFWERHIIDSAQLIRFVPAGAQTWIDLGSGAGLPGIIVAVFGFKTTLVEPRRLRAEFLRRVIEELGLRAQVCAARAESVAGTYDVISARAVTSLTRLLEISRHLSTGNTTWVLPKGKSAQSELAEARLTWQAAFHVERSLTNEDSSIIVAHNVRSRRR